MSVGRELVYLPFILGEWAWSQASRLYAHTRPEIEQTTLSIRMIFQENSIGLMRSEKVFHLYCVRSVFAFPVFMMHFLSWFVTNTHCYFWCKRISSLFQRDEIDQSQPWIIILRASVRSVCASHRLCLKHF